MPLTIRNEAARHEGFAFWRIVVWLMLLLAAYGCLQYMLHAEQLWRVLQPLPASDSGDIAQLRVMLAWDVGYFVASFAVIVICAGVILRQAWARAALQVACVLLAIGWGLVGGLHLYSQWREFSEAVTTMNAQRALDTASELAYAHSRRAFLMAMGTKVVGTPVLLWLAWSLGRPRVRGQFRKLRS
jgi:protein-S-isoprenylcysteine O-methyltransferase Ste14